MIGKLRLYMLYGLGVCIIAGCDDYYPHDPEGTLNRIQQTQTMRIGLVQNAPWVHALNEPPQGIEVGLVREFSAELGATPVWQPLSIEEGFDALKAGEIDLLLGGLVKSMPYKEAGFTRPYIETQAPYDPNKTEEYIMAVRRGENRFLIRLERFLKRHESAVRAKVSYETGPKT